MVDFTKPAPRVTPIGELLAEADEEVPFVVDGLFPTGGTSLVLGPPKVGKSTLMHSLIVAMAQGASFVGRQCAGGTVLYVALEEKRAAVRQRMRALGATADDSIFCYIDRVQLPGGLTAHQWLADHVERYRPVLVVVDPLARLVRLRDAGNDYMDATQQLEPFISLARDTGTHICFVHHSRKAGGEHGEEALGSTAIFGSVDTALSIQRDNDSSARWVYSINRYGEDLEHTALVLDDESGMVTLGTTRTGASAARIEAAVLDFVAGREGAVHHTDIVREVEGGSRRKQMAIRLLVDQGRLTRLGSGIKKDPFTYTFAIPAIPPSHREGIAESKASVRFASQ